MQKKQNHKTQLKYTTSNTFKSKGGEAVNSKSMTVQDESYTIRELLDRHTQGLMPPVGLSPEYDYDGEATHEDDVTFRKTDLDLTDIDEMAKKVKKTTEKVKKQRAKHDGSSDRTSTVKDEAKGTQRSGETQANS